MGYSEKTQEMMASAIFRALSRGDMPGMRASDWRALSKAADAVEKEMQESSTQGDSSTQ
jgi:hypothetical protein